MKRVIVVFLGIIMLLTFGCTKQGDTPAYLPAIRQQGKGLVDAFNRTDPDALAAFVTENVFLMPPNQPPVVGLEAVRAYWTEGFRVASSHLEISSEDLQVVGDLAIERFGWTVETQPAGGGARAKDNGKGLWVWRRQPDGSWKLAQAINNSENPVPDTLLSGAARPTS